MSIKENLQPEMEEAVQYKYEIECKNQIVNLEVDSSDVFQNADDEIDCPLDTVLRKNLLSIADFMNLNPKEARFIQMTGKNKTVLNSFSLNVNL